MDPDKSRTAVKYCGGCNSNFDRVLAAREVEALLGFPLPSAQPGRLYDTVFVISGCPVNCAGLSDLSARQFIIIDSLAKLKDVKGHIEQIIQIEMGNIMTSQIIPGLYRIGVPLPGNPLKELNSYVFKTQQRNLIIDTGFNQPECLAGLRAGIDELGLDMDQTDIFLTHLHSDHTGLATQIASPNSRIYMSTADKESLDHSLHDAASYWGGLEQIFLQEGFPPDELAVVAKANPGKRFSPPPSLTCTLVADGDIIQIGDFKLECIATPGHTPGHMCLYLREQKIMFSGDHILFDITPNISIWLALPDPLATYFESLKKISAYDVSLCLPGHRASSTQFQERVTALLDHHANRLNNVMDIVRAQPGITGYEVAKKMQWDIRTKDWTTFPPGQKWFAVGEALTHLTYLTGKQTLRKTFLDGCFRYSAE